MKSFEQLAQAAYAAYCACSDTYQPFPTWGELSPERRARWVAVARKVAEEIAAVH